MGGTSVIESDSEIGNETAKIDDFWQIRTRVRSQAATLRGPYQKIYHISRVGEGTGALIFSSRGDWCQEMTIFDVETQRYWRHSRFGLVLGSKSWVLSHGSGGWVPEI